MLIVTGKSEAKFLRPQFPDLLTYHTLIFEDTPFLSAFPVFQAAVALITAVLSGAGCRLLVQGNSGNNRSAAVVVAYLIAAQDLSYEAAFRHVINIRRSIAPSDFLVAQLRAFEPFVRSQAAAAAPPSSGNSRKRAAPVEELYFEDRG